MEFLRSVPPIKNDFEVAAGQVGSILSALVITVSL